VSVPGRPSPFFVMSQYVADRPPVSKLSPNISHGLSEVVVMQDYL
jgi:hypothetical protein